MRRSCFQWPRARLCVRAERIENDRRLFSLLSHFSAVLAGSVRLIFEHAIIPATAILPR
jgi:hypothetical protein